MDILGINLYMYIQIYVCVCVCCSREGFNIVTQYLHVVNDTEPIQYY